MKLNQVESSYTKLYQVEQIDPNQIKFRTH